MASISAETAPPTGEEIALWSNWTERTLKSTQSARDSLIGLRDRKALDFLSQASLSLVSIHGFIEKKKWSKVHSELGKVGAHLRKAGKIACEVDAKANAKNMASDN